jgi:hypothetical protein
MKQNCVFLQVCSNKMLVKLVLYNLQLYNFPQIRFNFIITVSNIKLSSRSVEMKQKRYINTDRFSGGYRN